MGCHKLSVRAHEKQGILMSSFHIGKAQIPCPKPSETQEIYLKHMEIVFSKQGITFWISHRIFRMGWWSSLQRDEGGILRLNIV